MKEWLENKLLNINNMLSFHGDNADAVYYYEGQHAVVIELLELIKKN